MSNMDDFESRRKSSTSTIQRLSRPSIRRASASSRRASLPSRSSSSATLVITTHPSPYYPPVHEQPLPPAPTNNELYDSLNTYTFGAAWTPPAPHSPASSDVDDGDDSARRDRSRAKMRAIDDGTRRPSLPNNEGPSSSGRRASRQEKVVKSETSDGDESDAPSLDTSFDPSRGSPPILDTHAGVAPTDVYEGIDMDFILSAPHPAVPPSFAPPIPSTLAPWLHRDSLGGNNDDSFTRFVKRHDPHFDARRSQCMFRKEGVLTNQTGGEIWSCTWLGKYVIARQKISASNVASGGGSVDGAERRHDRVIIRPMPNPDLGRHLAQSPNVLIHKHSRALAFSLFRGFNNYSTHQQPHLSTSRSILLAPERVLARYFDTKTTAKLRTHNQLNESEEATPPSDVTRNRSNPPSSSTPVQGTSSSSAYPRRASPTNTDISRSAASSRTSSPDNDESQDEDDSMDDSLPPRNTRSHAEALGALDQATIDKIRNRSSASPDIDTDSMRSLGNRSLADRFIRKFLPSTHEPMPVQLQPLTKSSAALVGQYTPPWLTTAPRSRQEEQERVIRNLNDSFRGVGLIPTFNSSGTGHGSEQHRRKHRKTARLFKDIPSDAMCMVLPLWASETDKMSAIADDADTQSHGSHTVPQLEDRKYLLVYYVPFDADATDDKGQKKRRRPTTPPTRSHSSSSHTVSLSAYRVTARLMSYGDLRNSGLRLPVEGLTVTGSLRDANTAIPSLEFVRTYNRHDGGGNAGSVVAVCQGRDLGLIELLPEGLDSLGLLARKSAPVMSPDEDDEVVAPLTAIGRAVVEMCWSGCIAVMSMSPSSSGYTTQQASLAMAALAGR